MSGPDMVQASVARVTTEVTVRLDVTEGPVLTKKYGKRQYRIVRVTIPYRREDDGPWKRGTVELAGPYVKKDGSDGVDENRDSLWSGSDIANLPWLVALVEQHMPEESQ